MSHSYTPLSARTCVRNGSDAKRASASSQKAVEAHEDVLKIYTHHAPSQNATNAETKGPLAGVEIGVKDIFDTYDQPTSYGSPIYKDHQPAADAAVIAMAREAGASIIGKTVTTEFAWFYPGPTCNPHNPDHTPGGSSSGSAAGVAAGYFPIAIGSQTGGSVIRPASFCGVAGYKPSFKLFPTLGMKQFSWSLDTVGFFATTVADAAFVAGHMGQRDLFVNEQATTPPVIGILKSTYDDKMDGDMRNAIAHMEKRAKAWGASVKSITSPDAVEAARAAHAPIQGYEAFRAMADERQRYFEKLSAPMQAYMKECGTISAETYDNARRTANQGRKASHSLFDTVDVLLVPSSVGAAPHGLESTGDSSFNQLWTLLGMPCVNVPGLTNAKNMPLGVQIIAPFGKDQKALQAAHWLESMIAKDKS